MDLSNKSPGQTTLSWAGHQPHLSSVFARLQLRSSLVDCSLASASGRSLRCHKLLLAAASPYLQKLLADTGAEHPVVILPHLEFPELQQVVEFVYRGEVSVAHCRLPAFLAASRSLQLIGLEHFLKQEVKEEEEEEEEEAGMEEEEEEEEEDEGEEVPQDLSMKSHSPDSKRRRLESALPPAPPLLRPLRAEAEAEQRRAQEAREAREAKQEGSKIPPWSQSQLQEAIEAVITQKLRFTQASAKYGIPKGTLYDNILGKSKRMLVLDQVGLTEAQELSVLEFCCEISSMPYNRRTSRSLRDIREFITRLKRKGGVAEFVMSMRQGFKWWWAFTKKHSIISLYYESHDPELQCRNRAGGPERSAKRRSVSPPSALLSLATDPSSTHITIPTSPLPIFPYVGLNGNNKFGSKFHSNFAPPPLAHSNVT